MKIIGSNDSPRPETPRVDRTPAKGGGDASVAKTAPAGTASDKVELSDLSRALASLGGQSADGASFDAARVDALKQAISSGEFKVNSENVADRLIQSVRELLGRKD